MLYDLYLSNPMATCYDNEGDAGSDGGQTDNGNQRADQDGGNGGDSSQGGQGGQDGDRTFTQEEVNKFLASDRRKHQERYEALEGSYQKLLENESLSKDERNKLEESLENLRAQYRTKEQQAAHERKQLEEEFTVRLDDVQQRGR